MFISDSAIAQGILKGTREPLNGHQNPVRVTPKLHHWHDRLAVSLVIYSTGLRIRALPQSLLRAT